MSDDDKNSPPSLESDDEHVPTAELNESTATPASPSKAKQGGAAAATPSNTPVVTHFSKVPQQPGANKRPLEAPSAVPTAESINELLRGMQVKETVGKKAPVPPKKGDPEDEDEDDDEDDDDDEDGGDEDGDEEEEDVYVATKEQMDVTVPLLRENQTKLEEVAAEYQAARRELELKFEAKRSEHYMERAKLIRGSENDNSMLPGFWLDAMSRSMLLSQFIEEWDQPALLFLDNITSHELTEGFGYKLVFHFGKNPFFSNATLEKTLHIKNLYNFGDSLPDIDESIGTEISWYPEKKLTTRIEVTQVKRAGGKKGGKKGGPKEIRQEVPQESFFSYFETRVEKSEEEMEALAEEEVERYRRDWEMDYAISDTIRTKLIPEAVLFYLGEADEDQYDDDEEDEDDEDGEFAEMDEEDEDDDEDDDEDEEEEKPVKGKKGAKGGKSKPLADQAGASGKAAGEQPECKQQ